MSERDYAPLSMACVRGLCDKQYEKRKIAGVEIEKMVKDFSDANNASQIKRLIRVLGQDLMSSTNPNVKNGALMGLSSVAVGLGKGCTTYLPELMHPIIACFSESESRVRYLACEALFNVVKMARVASMEHLPMIFSALARLAADPEQQVKQAAELLDRLVKDIVCECGGVEAGALVPLVEERLRSRGAAARQFAVSWLSLLDSLAGAPLLPHLPRLLDALFHMLDQPAPEIRTMVNVQLNEFLRSIKKNPSQVDFQAMINIIIIHAQSSDDLTQLTAITWMKEFVELSGRALLPFVSGMLTAALPCLAYKDDQRKSIRETAATVNLLLTKLIEPEEEKPPEEGKSPEPVADDSEEGDAEKAEAELDVSAVVGALSQLLQHGAVCTRAAALHWLLLLLAHRTQQMVVWRRSVFSAGMALVRDPADEVVRRALAVLAEICSASGNLETDEYYEKFIEELTAMLISDDNLLEDRGAFIIRQVCVSLSAESVYVSASRRCRAAGRRGARLVDALAGLLLTAAELYPLRARLRDFRTPETHHLFSQLHQYWSYSPVSLVALCLLTHNYHHCNDLVATFGDLEITVDFLTEIDKLVQLIESPIFAFLRLELCGAGSAELRRALFALLMLLPQSDAFHALRRRLHAAPHHTHDEITVNKSSKVDIDFAMLLDDFKTVQAQNRQHSLMEQSQTF